MPAHSTIPPMKDAASKLCPPSPVEGAGEAVGAGEVVGATVEEVVAVEFAVVGACVVVVTEVVVVGVVDVVKETHSSTGVGSLTSGHLKGASVEFTQNGVSVQL